MAETATIDQLLIALETSIRLDASGVISISRDNAEQLLAAAKADADPNFLIWSNEHMRWWGPGECGYVKELAKAGRYTRAGATLIVSRAQDGRGRLSMNQPPEIMVRESDALSTLRW